MAYDEATDRRVGEAVAQWSATRKKMFGGTGYMINGNMMCGVHGDGLILRLGESGAKEALGCPHVKPFQIKHPMKGWVMVEPSGFPDENALAGWLEKARVFTESLPPK